MFLYFFTFLSFINYNFNFCNTKLMNFVEIFLDGCMIMYGNFIKIALAVFDRKHFIFSNDYSNFQLDFLQSMGFKFENSKCHISVNSQSIEICFAKCSQNLPLSKAIIILRMKFLT